MTISTAITILGLGPGRWEDLTIQARAILEQAAKDEKTVCFRTLIHPIIEPLKHEIPDLHITSFDSFYDEASNWNTLFQRIAQEIFSQVEQYHTVVYAVPGHPLIGEASVRLILQQARERNISTRIVAGLSFLEPVCAALELDPFTSGVQIIDATDLAALRSDEVAGKVIPTVPLLVAHIYHRTLASDVKLALGECYPDVWPVKLVSSIDRTGSETVVEMPLYELDHTNLANQFNTLYAPPLAALDALRVPETLRYITMRLRRDPDGCPWDREQTHQSLTRYVIEETYEVVEALEENDLEKLAEELGDLLLQVYLHAEIARQDGDFNIGDVFEHVSAKLIRRHPHVFGQIEVENAGQVVQNWEEIKRQERIAAGKDVESESILDGVPLASPALIVAQKYQERAAKVGFDYDNLQQVLAKLTEELQELQEATTPEHRREEMGDVLFMVARIARELDIDAEEALRYANRKFRQRFQEMEHITRQEGRTFSSYNLDEWINLWNRVKG
ncbi:MAG: nucleoside triphosphate pyrophosphohydrolase [Ktedonobacteraceae bacterium]